MTRSVASVVQSECVVCVNSKRGLRRTRFLES